MRGTGEALAVAGALLVYVVLAAGLFWREPGTDARLGCSTLPTLVEGAPLTAASTLCRLLGSGGPD